MDAGIRVIGIDNLNDYYALELKQLRLKQLHQYPAFTFHHVDISNYEALTDCVLGEKIDGIVHLAAQAGVRYSIEAPFAYANSNLVGHLSVLELARHAKKPPKIVYASSSSVYGGNTKVPFSEADPVENPVSLYAATKRSCEILSQSYAKLYDLNQIGLRFFTVYGPLGRPDMAYWLFAEKILAGEEIPIFNHGDQERDFTYIDDITAGVCATILEPMKPIGETPHRIYNIGNNKPVRLLRFIEILEEALGTEARKRMEPMQPGDVKQTYADISQISSDYGFSPRTPLEEGIPRFVEWFKDYRGNSA